MSFAFDSFYAWKNRIYVINEQITFDTHTIAQIQSI